MGSASTGASTWTQRGRASATTWRCRGTSTRWRCSRPSRRSAPAPPPSSRRRQIAPGTSSTWATASCPRPRSITCARWSTPSTSCRRGSMPADGVLLLAFGGPTRAEEIRPFLANVLRGRPVPPERVEEVVRHYEAIGGRSPLNDLTFRQAHKLEATLTVTGPALRVYVGMRNWEPYVADTLARMAGDGVRSAVGVILSPHASEASRERYLEEVKAALRALAADGARDVVVVPVGFVCDHVEVLYDLDVEARATARAAGLGFARASTVNDHPLFIQMLAEVVAAAAA